MDVVPRGRGCSMKVRNQSGSIEIRTGIEDVAQGLLMWSEWHTSEFLNRVVSYN